MEIKKPKNSNYAAVVTKITSLIPLEGCDFVQAVIIMGNQVIVDKSTKVGDMGLYFPLECQLSSEYVSNNNLYRNKTLNVNPEKSGYFEENRRIRCVKFRGHKSEGLFMPLLSLDFVGKYNLKEGTEFDELNGIPICNKYIIPIKNSGTSNKAPKTPKETKIIENQFRFHEDTSQLYKNLHKISPFSVISITYKIHGTSGISSKVLCKKPLKWYERVLKYIGISIVNTQYDYIYSSRKVIKNPELSPNVNHYYNMDIWGMAHDKIKDLLAEGMTIYYEIAGYLPTGGFIQKDYDYGCEVGNFEIYVYRITYTNVSGKVFEFSHRQVMEWCLKNNIKFVPTMFYGYAKELSDERMTEENWRNKLLETLKAEYTEKECWMCNNKVPEEGCVIRVEGLEFEAYKLKSNLFYERETKLLDKGESDIESEN